MRYPRRTKCICILSIVLCLILASMPVLARSYPYADREEPYDGDVLQVSNLQAVTSAAEEALLQDTGILAPAGNTNLPANWNPDVFTADGSARSCGSLLHDRHTVGDFAGVLTDTGLPKAPVSGEAYTKGYTKEIYNDLSNGAGGTTFTAEVIYSGTNCTVWQEAGAASPVALTGSMAGIFLRLVDEYLLPAIYTSFRESVEPASVDVDSDGRIALVFSSMGEDTTSCFTDGDLFADTDVSWATGNQMDMLHINSSASIEEAFAAISHELAHLILFSRTLGESDLWLEEVIAQYTLTAAQDGLETFFIPLPYSIPVPEADALMDTIHSQGISAPFIGGGNYVPSGSIPYGQWYLFAHYLAGQTAALPGGGDTLWQTILDTAPWSENGFTAGSCTIEVLIQALTDMGYIGNPSEGAADFEDVILNYNTALLLRDADGIYSLTNSGEGDVDTAGHIAIDRITPFDGTIMQLPGGGASCWLKSSGSITPAAHGTDIRYAGIYTEPLVIPAPVTSSVPSGNVDTGTSVSLSCETEGAQIYYTTDENNLTMEDGTLYTEPLTIHGDTYLRAWAVKTTGTEKIAGPETTFRYQVSGPIGDRYEANNDFTTATSVSFPGKYNATIHQAEDTDYYTFTLEHPAVLHLTLTSPAGTSYGLSLYRENGLPEKEEQKTSLLTNGTQSIRMKAESGTYYAVVTCSVDEACSDQEAYTLDLQRECDTADNLTDLDFSEIHMVSALADNENSPLAYNNVLDTGGHFLYSSAYLTSWAGPVCEKDFPYPDEVHQEDYKPEYEESEPLYHVQNILYLPTEDRETFVAHLKNAVYSYGAAEIYVMSAKHYQADNSTYWYVDQENYKYNSYNDVGHIVTVVGWDDTIPRELFCGSGYYATPLPEEDGAFIVRNSWGAETGEEGYFYLSYEDFYMNRNNPAVYIADESADNYNHQYLSDTKGGADFLTFDGQDSGTVSEVFTLDNQDSPELLKAVSMQIASADTHYEISVRIGGQTAQKVAEGTKKYSGYYTERLDTPILVPAGETFEIIVRLECTTEAPSILVTANCDSNGSTSGIPAIPEKAFLYDGGDTPYDLSSQAIYPCIRAFTCDVTTDGYRATTPSQTGKPGKASDGQADSLPEHVTLTPAIAPDQEQGSRFGALAAYSLAGSQAEVPVTNLPEQFDLRDTLTLTPVRDQGKLGVCWAFASTACVENSLASRDINVVDYPSSLSLSHSSYAVVLDTALKEQAVSLTADLNGSTNPPSSKIYWSITGDMDSIRMEHTESFSGEPVQLFTALAPGTVTVTAQSDADMNVRASCKVTITNQGIESLELTPQRLEMKTGECKKLTAVALPKTAVDKTILFESSDPGVAYVDQDGNVTALSEGTAVITARGGTAEAFCEVTVAKQASQGKPSGTSSDSSKDPTNRGNGSATGDTAPVSLLALLALLSAVMIGVIIRLKRRH